jgi:two-component sensor histidine kinase/PAS domain-containing protein
VERTILARGTAHLIKLWSSPRNAAVAPVNNTEGSFDTGPESPRDAGRSMRDAAEDATARLAIVMRLARLVNSTLDPSRVCDFIAESTSHLLEGAVVLLLVAAGPDGPVHLRAAAGLARPELRDQDEYATGEGLIGWVFQHRMPLILTDMLADPRTRNRAWVQAEGLRAFAGVPLLVWGRCLGVLYAGRSGERPFAPADIDLLQLFAAHAATALQNAEIYRETEAEAQQLRALIESMPAAVVVAEGSTDGRSFRLRMGNRAWKALQAPADGADTCADWMRPDGTPLRADEHPLQRAIRWGEPTKEAELLVRFRGGRRHCVLVNAVLLPGAGETRQAVGIILDITERRQAEEALRQLAAEHAAISEQAAYDAKLKGLLLDELNHRVRNNLALIVSFLELQRATPEGQSATAVLEEAIDRVKGLGLVHNVLEDAGIRASQYEALVHRLAEQTFLQGTLRDRVTLRVYTQPLLLPSRVLTALGIITNELFTNIAKHAFPGERRGAVEVRVETVGDEVVIRIRDDGVGLSSGLSAGTGRLGLRLVRSLVDVSLHGTCALQVDQGTAACIRFPLPNAGEAGAPDTQASSRIRRVA